MHGSIYTGSRNSVRPRTLRRMLVGLAACALVVAALLSTGPVALAAEDAQENDEPGVLVVRVRTDSPAATAGLRRGDIILTVDDTTVNSTADLMRALAAREPGETVEITYLHGDDERTASTTLAERDGDPLLGIVPLREGPVNEGWIESMPLNRGQGPMMRFLDEESRIEGAFVIRVVEGSPAEEAGLQPGDVILSVDSEAVTGGEALVEAIAGYAPGDKVSLEVRAADDQARTVEATLAEREDDAERAFLGLELGPSIMFRAQPLPGVTVPITPEMGMVAARPLAGVLIQAVAEDGPAAAAGLEAGDLIVAVNGEPVDSLEALRAMIAAAEPGDDVELTVHSLGDMPRMFRWRAGGGGTNEAETERTEDADDAEKRSVTVTLGETEEGGAYLGISASTTPRIQIRRFESDAPRFHGEPCPCGLQHRHDLDEGPGEMFFWGQPGAGPQRFFWTHPGAAPNSRFYRGQPQAAPGRFFFRGQPGEMLQPFFFRAEPEQWEGPEIEITPAPVQPNPPSQSV